MTTAADTTLILANRLSWGAIIAGAFVAVGLWMLLDAFGMAVGLTSIRPSDGGSARTIGIVTGVWSMITPLIALFVGAMVTARAAGVIDRVSGLIHGMVLWALTTVAGAFLIGAALSMLIGGAASIGGKAVQGAASAATQATQAVQGSQSGSVGDAFDALGLNADQLLQPVNQRLQQQGKPAINAQQLRDAAQDAVQRGLREGRLDRESLVGAIADKTSLSRQDAEDLAGQIQGAFDQRAGQAKQQLEQKQQQVQTAALEAANSAGKAFWGVFAVLILGFAASLAGSAIGARPATAANR